MPILGSMHIVHVCSKLKELVFLLILNKAIDHATQRAQSCKAALNATHVDQG